MNLSFKLILTLFLFILFGCFKDESKDQCKDSKTIVRTHDFNSDYYPHVMIYKDLENIRFLKNGVDTILFYGDRIRVIDEIVSAQKGCGRESFKAVMQSFKNLTGDSIVLFYSVMLNYSLSIDQFTVSFKDTLFNQFSEYIVKCDSTVTVLGKSYCVRKMLADNGHGLPYIYYAKDYGLIKVYLKNDVYERIP